MRTEVFEPLLTAEVPVPTVEPGTKTEGEARLPRCLLEVAGRTKAARRVVAISFLFALLVALEALLLRRLSLEEPLVVYQEPPARALLSP